MESYLCGDKVRLLRDHVELMVVKQIEVNQSGTGKEVTTMWR